MVHIKKIFKKKPKGTSLVVQWLRLLAPNTGGPGSIPGQGTRSHMPQQRHSSAKLKKKKRKKKLQGYIV